MARFDFTEAAARGYVFTWKNRKEILHLATLPMLVKLGSYSAIALLNLEGNLLRQGLLLLPAYFLEGFLIVQVIRMALYNEKASGLFVEDPGQRHIAHNSRRRAVVGGTVAYLLTKLASSLLASWTVIAEKVEDSPAMPEPHGSVFVTSLMIFVFLIWAFRFFWLYIPVAMDFPVKDFLYRIRGFMASVHMIGLWVLCFVPMAMVLIAVAKLAALVFVTQSSVPYVLVVAAAQAVIELGIVLVSSVGMAFAFDSIIKGQNKPPRLF